MGGASQSDAANLVEIFASAQGEGPWVGAETIFVRLGECDLRCAWCDSPGTWRRARRCRIEEAPGTGRFRDVDNPVSIETVDAALGALAPVGAGFASLTGGEPLLQPEAVRAIAERARARGMRSYLETHGLAVEALAAVIDAIDVVSMDWKLESDVAPAPGDAHGEGEVDFTARHTAFLERALDAGAVYVKTVLTPNTTETELDEMCDAIASVAPAVPLVLQPVTPFGRVRERPSASRILDLQRRCAARLRDVRVIPQTHRSYDAL